MLVSKQTNKCIHSHKKRPDPSLDLKMILPAS